MTSTPDDETILEEQRFGLLLMTATPIAAALAGSIGHRKTETIQEIADTAIRMAEVLMAKCEKAAKNGK